MSTLSLGDSNTGLLKLRNDQLSSFSDEALHPSVLLSLLIVNNDFISLALLFLLSPNLSSSLGLVGQHSPRETTDSQAFDEVLINWLHVLTTFHSLIITFNSGFYL